MSLCFDVGLFDDCHKWALCSMYLLSNSKTVPSAHGAAVLKGPTPAVQRQLHEPPHHTPRRPPPTTPHTPDLLGQSRRTPRPTPHAPSTHPITACIPRLRQRRHPLAHIRHHSPRYAPQAVSLHCFRIYLIYLLRDIYSSVYLDLMINHQHYSCSGIIHLAVNPNGKF